MARFEDTLAPGIKKGGATWQVPKMGTWRPCTGNKKRGGATTTKHRPDTLNTLTSE